jgi:hypothetical protein
LYKKVLKLTLKRSKTDQFGEGSVKGLPYFDNSQYCPVFQLRKWIEISKINSGPLFRRFTKGSKLSDNRLTDQTVALLIKEYLKLAGIESKNYSGHSLRSGFATSAAESGAEERSIMAMTGHKSTEMVRRYIKEANLFKNNALNKIKIKFGSLMNSISGLFNSSLFKYSNTLLPPILEEITIFVDLDSINIFSFKLMETSSGNCSHR